MPRDSAVSTSASRSSSQTSYTTSSDLGTYVDLTMPDEVHERRHPWDPFTPKLSRSHIRASRSSSGSSLSSLGTTASENSLTNKMYVYEGIPDDLMDVSSYDKESETEVALVSSRRSSACCDPFIGSVLSTALCSPPCVLLAGAESQDSGSTLSRSSSRTLEGRQAISLTRRSTLETARESLYETQISRSLPNAKLSFRLFKRSLQLLKPRLGVNLHRTSTLSETPSRYIFGSASVRKKSLSSDAASRSSIATRQLDWDECGRPVNRSSLYPSDYQGCSMRATDSPTPSMWSRSSSVLSSGPTCLVDRLDSRAHIPTYQRGLRKQMYPPRVRYSSSCSSTFVPVLGQPF